MKRLLSCTCAGDDGTAPLRWLRVHGDAICVASTKAHASPSLPGKHKGHALMINYDIIAQCFRTLINLLLEVRSLQLLAALKGSKHAPAGNVKTGERENWAVSTSGVRPGPRLPSRLCSRLSVFPYDLTSGHMEKEAELPPVVQFDQDSTEGSSPLGLQLHSSTMWWTESDSDMHE